MAELHLATLLKTLKVKRHDGVWRFETIPPDQASWTDLINLSDVRDIAMLFQETEGLTVITKATDDTPEDNCWVWLELAVYSDLQAVGFLAAVTDALAKARVPSNAVAAFHHDHIFVPAEKADSAIIALQALAEDN